MMMNTEACYRALSARDKRFDGQFFIAVKTTGIFCRPICPARTPKAANVEFYPSAAAAHGAGFRPCLRCRPEVAPFSAAWQGTEATVTRALRMIEQGALDDDDLEGFAGRLGVSGRHLRRLFDQYVGASPVEVALTQRVLFAKELISDTQMPLTDVAFAAGFRSVRRFNDAFQSVYHRPPREIRRGSAAVEARHWEIRLPFVGPYRWDLLAKFVQPRLIEGLESLEGNIYRRQTEDGTIQAEFRADAEHILLRLPRAAARRTGEWAKMARSFFDTGANPQGIAAGLSSELPIVVGIRLPGAWSEMEVAVRAVLGQQISVAVATRLAAKLWERSGGFTAERLTRVDLSGIGLSARQQTTIRGLSEGVISGTVRWNKPETLQTVKGIGPWTAGYVAMRLGDPDAFPVGDLYLKPFGDGAQFRPWRAYAAMSIWMQERA